jgi:hypothetical protein
VNDSNHRDIANCRLPIVDWPSGNCSFALPAH